MPTLPTPGGDNNTWGTELNEYLQVAHDGDGTPKSVGTYTTSGHSADRAVTANAYTITNVTTDRAYDANSYTGDELADVLGTLVADFVEARNVLMTLIDDLRTGGYLA